MAVLCARGQGDRGEGRDGGHNGAMPPEPSSSLHTTSRGDHGSLVVFCHGLFGQGRNWTAVAKALADEHRSLLVDLPHHGRSSWDGAIDYPTMAEQVAGLLSAEDPVTLVGHSMGGKVAMVLALRHPELVRRLCVVDIAPVGYDGGSEFGRYAEALRAIELGTLERREQAEEVLAAAVPDRSVRDFLLQNLRREGDGWRWQADLEGLRAALPAITGWPEDALAGASYDGPVLWVSGSESAYVSEDDEASMARWFPRHRRVVVKGAGHWVHAQKPEVFVEVLRRFASDAPPV